MTWYSDVSVVTGTQWVEWSVVGPPQAIVQRVDSPYMSVVLEGLIYTMNKKGNALLTSFRQPSFSIGSDDTRVFAVRKWFCRAVDDNAAGFLLARVEHGCSQQLRSDHVCAMAKVDLVVVSHR